MTALDKQVKELRPHHVKSAFFGWPFVTKEAIAERHRQDGYSPRHIENMLEIYARVIEQNSPFIIVPAIDDICAACNYNLDNELGCSRPLNLDIMAQNDLVMHYGIKQGGPYLPSEIIARIIEKGACFGDGTIGQYLIIQGRLKNNGGKLK